MKTLTILIILLIVIIWLCALTWHLGLAYDLIGMQAQQFDKFLRMFDKLTAFVKGYK